MFHELLTAVGEGTVGTGTHVVGAVTFVTSLPRPDVVIPALVTYLFLAVGERRGREDETKGGNDRAWDEKRGEREGGGDKWRKERERERGREEARESKCVQKLYKAYIMPLKN